MNIGRKLYYELTTGNIIQDCGERQGSVVETTEDQDFQTYPSLQSYQQNQVGVIQCDYGYELTNFMKYPFHIDTKNPIDQTAIIFYTDYPLGTTLDQAKQTKITEINNLYYQKLSDGFTSTILSVEYTFDYGQNARDKFMQLAIEILSGKATFPVTVHPKDGSNISLDQTQYNQLVSDIATFAEPLDKKQHDYIVQINNCTTVKQIYDINIAF